jgi:hypothetical protein
MFIPQMTGGAFPPGLVTTKESRRHSLAVVTFLLAVAGRSTPLLRLPTTLTKLVPGPEIEKVLKSSLN